ncbi:MAG TPA: aminotransferase class III-fold pyridoxal phosphate-dependent enzyme, partial [Verrucomicrobiae bacterium]|nr:aminotransferase class III-fold pyridoxal phosphate-dependent enzyme [Verrucomicrobiae bacterium]
GLTSGYMPLGAVLVSATVAAPFWEAGTERIFRHGYTYSGHPTACAVALANLAIIEREGLLDRARSLEAVLASALEPLRRLAVVAEVRCGLGLLAGIEIAPERRRADPDLVARLVSSTRDHGVLTRGLAGRSLQISPPLVISPAQIGEIAGVLETVLSEAA